MNQAHEGKDTLRDFTANPLPYLQRMRQSGKPLVLMAEGEGEVVVQDLASFRRLSEQMERLETLASVREGLRDVAEDRTRPMREVLAQVQYPILTNAVFRVVSPYFAIPVFENRCSVENCSCVLIQDDRGLYFPCNGDGNFGLEENSPV